MGVDIERELKIAEMCFDGSMFNGDIKKLEAVGIIDEGIKDRVESLLTKIKMMNRGINLKSNGVYYATSIYYKSLYSELMDGPNVKMKDTGKELILNIIQGVTGIEDETLTRIFNLALKMNRRIRITGGTDMIYLKNILLSNPKIEVTIDTDNIALMTALMFMRCHSAGRIREINVHKKNVCIIMAIYCYSRSRSKGDSLITGEGADDVRKLYEKYEATNNRSMYKLDIYSKSIVPLVKIDETNSKYRSFKEEYDKISHLYRMLEVISYANLRDSDITDMTIYRIMRIQNMIGSIEKHDVLKAISEKLKGFSERAVRGYYEAEGKVELKEIIDSIADKENKEAVYRIMHDIYGRMQEANE